MDAHHLPSILSGLRVFSQLFRGKEVLLGDGELVRAGDTGRVMGDATSRVTDPCAPAVVKNPGKINGSIECRMTSAHCGFQTNSKSFLFNCTYSHAVRHFNQPSPVTAPAANQANLPLPKATSEWHTGLAGVAGSLSHWTRIMRLSRCQASVALL